MYGSIIAVILFLIGCVSVYMFILWLASLVTKDASIVDIFWGPGFALALLITSLLMLPLSMPQFVIIQLTFIWAFRLGLFLAIRNTGKPEDSRYAAWRTKHGSSYWWISAFLVFGLQGVVMIIVSSMLVFAMYGSYKTTISTLGYIGIAVWLCGLLLESIADLQLYLFKRKPDNAGKILTSGLWKHSRHPNYFGEIILWWGFYLVAIDISSYWWTIYSPALMTFLLIKVSGAAMLDRTMQNKNPDYAARLSQANALMPWPKRR